MTVSSDSAVYTLRLFAQQRDLSFIRLADASERAQRAEQERDIERSMRVRLEKAVTMHLRLTKQLEELREQTKILHNDEYHLVSSDYIGKPRGAAAAICH